MIFFLIEGKKIQYEEENYFYKFMKDEIGHEICFLTCNSVKINLKSFRIQVLHNKKSVEK